MTHSAREAQYIKETGDKRPDFKDYGNDLRYSYEADYDEWKNGFISWLEKQLEKVEKGLKEASRLWFEIPYGYYPDNDEGDHFEDCERGLTRLLKNFNQE